MTDRETMPIMQGVLLKAIPWALVAPHERQAQSNHGQTLERLAQRGGLCPSEALAVIRDDPWQKFDELSCERALMRLILAHAIAEVAERLKTKKHRGGFVAK